MDKKIDLGSGCKVYPKVLVVADGCGYWHTVSLDDYLAVNLNDSVSINPNKTVEILNSFQVTD